MRGSHVSETEECGLDLHELTTCEFVKTTRDRWNLKVVLSLEIKLRWKQLQQDSYKLKSRVTELNYLVLCGGEVWAILSEHSTQD